MKKQAKNDDEVKKNDEAKKAVFMISLFALGGFFVIFLNLNLNQVEQSNVNLLEVLDEARSFVLSDHNFVEKATGDLRFVSSHKNGCVDCWFFVFEADVEHEDLPDGVVGFEFRVLMQEYELVSMEVVELTN